VYATSEAANTVGSCLDAPEALVGRPNAPERDLVQQLQAGDEMAFRALIDRYQSKVYRLAYGILRNRDDADEIAQQVFVKVYFSVKGFDARSSLYTWIHRIAVNECYQFLRKNRLKLSYESDSAENTISVRVQMARDPRPTCDRVVVQRDLLNRLLERLPEEERHLLLLKELEGYSVAQLSEETGLNENTIKVRLFRTRQRLAKAAMRLRCPPLIGI
jgi:RNA polymerase sigma-70 factor, ECF subfamily